MPDTSHADFDPALVEQAARVLHAERCCPCDPTGCGEPDPQDYSAARVVLTAVAPTLRAEGEKQILRALPQGWVVLWRRAEKAERERDTAYQRGMVAGARQVRGAVQVAHDRQGTGEVEACEWLTEYCPELVAAREAVARIEGGAA